MICLLLDFSIDRWGRRWGSYRRQGCQTSDSSLRLQFSIYNWETTGYFWWGTTTCRHLKARHHCIFLRRPRDNFQPCLWQLKQLIEAKQWCSLLFWQLGCTYSLYLKAFSHRTTIEEHGCATGLSDSLTLCWTSTVILCVNRLNSVFGNYCLTCQQQLFDKGVQTHVRHSIAKMQCVFYALEFDLV